MGITVKAASESDYHDLCLLEQGPSGNYYQAAVFVRQAMVLWPGSVLVAEYDGQLAGFLVGAVSSEDTQSGWILRVKVKEENRRKGIGTALIHHFAHQMHQTRKKRILLSCSPGNLGALNLYERCGFRISHHEPGYFGPEEPRFILYRDI